jgi:hypothetical protein
MAYKAILVHVPLANAKVQVELAARLAKAFGAHLTGICSLTETAMLRSAVQNPFIRLEGRQGRRSDRAGVGGSLERGEDVRHHRR